MGVIAESILPTDRFVRCAFYTPTGCVNVRKNEMEIIGDWAHKASNYYGDRGNLLAQRFANSPSDARSILKFTQRWSPILGNPYDGRDGFQFTVESWAATQKAFQQLWRVVQRTGSCPFQPVEPVVVEFVKGRPLLQCQDLYTFMCFELMSNASKLRTCKRENCGNPYFLAQHGKEQYCSIDCSNWAQSIWKKRWHEDRRQKRLKVEVSSGTHKTG
jgi:hypothetical protein